MTSIRSKLPVNKSKHIKKSSGNEGKQKTVATTREDSNKGLVEFDWKFLLHYFRYKVHAANTVNINGLHLISPVKKISKSLSQVKDITQVLADDNQLQLNDFHIFPNVTSLSLRHNNLHHIDITSANNGSESGDQNRSYFQFLARLDLSFNQLEYSSLNSLNQLRNLRQIKLSSNRIKFFTDANNINQLTKLVRLELCDNRIESCKIFHQLSTLQSLQVLLLNNNYLRCIPLLLRSETTEKVYQINSLGDQGEECNNSENSSPTDDTSQCSSSTFDSEKTHYLLSTVYHPQTTEMLSLFRPRTLSILYEDSESRSTTGSEDWCDPPGSSDYSTDSSEDDLIPINHVPFPSLHTLYIKFNRFQNEHAILGASLWPNMKKIYIRGNRVAKDFNVFDTFARFNIVVHYT
ncbi:hypothetical protein WDU94_008133 [Cyamophila willieti]